MFDRRRLILAGAALLATGVASRASAQSQQPAALPGRVSARRFLVIPPRQRIAVAPLDDRPENLRIAEALRRALERAGHVVGETGAIWRLSFDSEVRPLAGGLPPRPNPAAPAGETTREVGPPDSLPDRPVRPAPAPGRAGAPMALLRYVLNATLDENATGKRGWQGSVRYDAAEMDRARMLLRLVPPLMETFGRGQTARAFALE
jgi:hypothetical protein